LYLVKKKKAAVGYHRLQLSRKIRNSCDLGWRRSTAEQFCISDRMFASK
jgi:hypothetical protein